MKSSLPKEPGHGWFWFVLCVSLSAFGVLWYQGRVDVFHMWLIAVLYVGAVVSYVVLQRQNHNAAFCQMVENMLESSEYPKDRHEVETLLRQALKTWGNHDEVDTTSKDGVLIYSYFELRYGFRR